VNLEEADDVVKEQAYKRSQQAFFAGTANNNNGQSQTEKNQETYEDALRVFYGVEAPRNEAQKLGDPIPGYCGVNRRVQADNVFGMTYAEARRRAQESQNRIEVEKGETLKATSTFVPEYLRPKQED